MSRQATGDALGGGQAMDEAMPGGHAFVSYAHADFAYVRRLVAWLAQRGVELWCDEEIPTGQRWESVLRERVESCAVLVLVMSPDAAASEWVRREVRLARSLGKPVLPLLLAGEVILDLDGLQYESVLDRRQPTDAFVDRLPRRATPSDRIPRARVRHPVGLVPNPADCFQDRDLLAQLTTALSHGGTAIVTQVLTGLGGVGKTQLAAAVARRLIDEASLDLLMWVNATSRDAVVSVYAQAAHEVCGADLSDPETAAQTLLQWLASTTGQWLVVLDDVTDPADLAGLWPPASRSGRVVVTTRRRDAALASHGRLIPVGLFTKAQATAYLAQKFATRPDRLVGADQLAEDLGYLPLMLGQAAAFITDQEITCQEYRHRFAQAKNLVEVVPEPGQAPDDYRLPVAAALLLSVDLADRLRPAGWARPLLAMLSLLDPNGVPIEVVTAPATAAYLTEHGGSGNDTDPGGAPPARDALMGLARLNLVDVVTEQAGTGQRVRVHGLVQRAMREQSPPDVIADAASAAAAALAQVWPDVERDTTFAQQLRSNVAALRSHAEDHLWVPDAHALLFRVGRSLGEAGLVGEAIAHFDQFTAQSATRLGPEHPDTLTTRNNLAYMRGEAGDAVGAAAAFEALLTDTLRVLGPDHSQTLITRHNLARWRGAAGDAVGAAAAFEALLTDRLRVLGPEHPDTLATRHNLAYWRGAAGDAAGAAVAFEALLADRLRVFGPDHPDTLVTRNSLARWRGEAGDRVGAASAFEALLADYLRVLGPEHPSTLVTRNNLAYWRRAAGDRATTTPRRRRRSWRRLWRGRG